MRARDAQARLHSMRTYGEPSVYPTGSIGPMQSACEVDTFLFGYTTRCHRLMPQASSTKSLGRIFLEKVFPQVRALTPMNFRDYCTDRGISVDLRLRLLERLDLQGLVPPMLRVSREKVSPRRSVKVSYGIIQTSVPGLQSARSRGLVEFPEDIHSRPWKEYKESYNEVVVPLYHPLQVLMVEPVARIGEVTFSDSLLEAEPEDILARVTKFRENRAAWLRGIGEAIKQREQLIRLILLVEDAFLPDLRSSFIPDPMRDFWDWFAEWSDWRRNLDWKSVILSSGWTVDEVRSAYEFWAIRAVVHDPLERWYILASGMRYEKRRKLKGSALLAQDLYDIAMMLKWLYEYATGESLPMPDEVTDLTKGAWKEEWYGAKAVLTDRRAMLRLLTEYGLNPVYRVHLILEGKTEMTFVPLVAEAMGFDFEQLGVDLHGLDGAQKANRGRLEDLLHHLAEEDAVPYVILDNDADVSTHLKD